MAAHVPPGAPRPGYSAPPPPNYTPNYHRSGDGLAENMQNMNINRQMPNSAPKRPPPPFDQSSPPPFPPSASNPSMGFSGTVSVSRPVRPPGAFARPSMPPGGPSQSMMHSSVNPGILSGPPNMQPSPFVSRPPPGSMPPSIGNPGMGSSGAFQSFNAPSGAFQSSGFASGPVMPPVSGARPGGFGNPPMTTGPIMPPSGLPGPLTNGSPMYGSGGPQQPPVGPPPTMFSARAPIQAPQMRSVIGGPPTSAPPVPGQLHPPFSTGSQGMPPPPGSPYASQAWPVQQRPGMYGMQPPPPNQSLSGPHAMGHPGTSMGGPSKIDPNQIPRPLPNSPVVIYETRQGNQASPPPPATSEYIVKDTGNCSPRYMRCTIHQIPCTNDLLTTSGMPLALLVQPLALPHPSEEPIQIVDFGESGPMRCSRCKGYVNPFMKFIDQGKHFICNLCGFTDETPREYHCNLGPDGRRRDADDRPELCRGTVEFVASKEYMVREPMPAVFFFLIDVSMNAIQTGATAAACSAISQVIADLPEGPRTMVGVATFDVTIHFYNLKRALQQPLMLIVPDIHDVYTPLQTDIIVQLSECRPHMEILLENIPTMFQQNRTTESAFGAAIKAAFLAMKNTGGKLLAFHSGKDIKLPHEANKLLQPADKTLKTMAIEFAEYQVCVDVFLTTQNYADLASISVVPRTTGGQVYYYYPFSALTDPAKLYNDLRWNVTRPQGFEAVMRVRCSQGLQVQDYSGNFCKHIPTDVDLPGIDCDKTIMVTLKHDDKLQDGSECSFQCALLYTTVYGQRRIRVTTLSLPCTTMLSNLFRSADLDSQFVCLMKQVASEIPSSSLSQARDNVMNLCITILHAYRKFCATVSSSGQLILPEGLKLLPMYTLALTKGAGLRNEGRIDDRSYWINYVSSVSTALAIPLVYPRMIAIHGTDSKDDDGLLIPPSIPLSSEHVSDKGIYLLENGEDALIYVGNTVESEILQQLFGISSIESLPTQYVPQLYDNPVSKKFNDTINEIRRQRCSYLRLRLCKNGDPSGMLFFSYLIEDKGAGLSYVEFLVLIHRQIQNKMN